jgi:hypothetical protein
LAAEVLGQELLVSTDTTWIPGDILVIIDSLVVAVLGGELFETFWTP